MRKRIQHFGVLLLLIFSFTQTIAQIAMPDTVCVGTARLYSVNDATVPSSYTWKLNGVIQNSTRNDISIAWNSPGIFQLTVQEHPNSGCNGDIKSGLVYVNPLPIANAGPDATICFGNDTRLNGNGGTVYQWSPATYLSNATLANPVATLPFAGTFRYILTVSSNGCKSAASDTVAITILPPVKVFAGSDTSIAISQPLQLNAIDINNSGFTTYTWAPSFGLSNAFIKNPVAVIDRNTAYIVTAQTTNGCIAKDDIYVKVFAGVEIYVPNAFTPNKDGLNDVLKPVIVGIKELRYFAIYNRYGQLVYKTSIQGAGWDGMIKGKMQNSGAYVWVAEAVDYKGSVLSKKGTAILVK